MKTLREMMDLIESAQTVDEMDKSQPGQQRHGDYPLGIKNKDVSMVKPTTKKKVVKDMTKELERTLAKEKTVKESGETRGIDDPDRVHELSKQAWERVHAKGKNAFDRFATRMSARALDNVKIDRKTGKVVDEGAHWGDNWQQVDVVKSTKGRVLGVILQNAINGTFAFYDDKKADLESGFSSAQEARQAYIDYFKARQSINEFAPGNGGEEDDPSWIQFARNDGNKYGVELNDSATLARALEITSYDTIQDGRYKNYFVQGFIEGRQMKIDWAKRDGVELRLRKDGSIARAGQIDEEQLEETSDEAVAKVEQLFRDKR